MVLGNGVVRSLFVILMLSVFLFAAVSAFSGNRSDDPLGIAVSPQTLILNFEQGGHVCVHTDIPYGTVNKSSLALSGVPVWWTKADLRGCLVAYFHEEDVEAIVSPPSATLTLTGLRTDGTAFSGSDTVSVIIQKN